MQLTAVNVPSANIRAMRPAGAIATPAATTEQTAVNQVTTWTNPAAAAAMRSTVDLLTMIQDGITRNFQDPSRVSAFASDLRSTYDIYGQATDAIQQDDSKENDAFLPLILKAGTNISDAQEHLLAKNFNATWPLYRNDILAQVRTARSLSQNVADQLDPRSIFTSPT
ncbi:MAG: hypothetical protein JWN41_359 [Thermoleophilia bacterium]|nr:hypothetical protein [Thermoleophilia bacterium]